MPFTLKTRKCSGAAAAVGRGRRRPIGRPMTTEGAHDSEVSAGRPVLLRSMPTAADTKDVHRVAIVAVVVGWGREVAGRSPATFAALSLYTELPDEGQKGTEMKSVAVVRARTNAVPCRRLVTVASTPKSTC